MNGYVVATKYVRQRMVGVRRREPPTGFLLGLSRLGPKRRLIVIYAGLGCFAMLLLIYHYCAGAGQFEGKPLLRGEGLIVDKRLGGAAGDVHILIVKVVLDMGLGPADFFRTDAETWNRLAVGDRVAVIYQTNRDGTRARVREVGRVALNESVRWTCIES